MNSLPVWARQYVRLVMLSGAALSTYAVYGHQISDLWNLLMMTILACEMSTVKVRLHFGQEHCSLSMAFPFTFAALLHFGWREGVIVAVLCAATQCWFNSPARPALYRLLFSVAALVLTVAFSAAAYTLCRGPLPLSITNIAPAALLVGVTVYWLANTGLVSAAVSLSAGKPFWPVWAANLRWSMVNFTLGGFLAILLVYFFQAVGIGIFVLISPLLYLTHYVYKLGFIKEIRQ